MSRRSRELPLFRWLALAGAGGAAAVSGLQHFEIAGPWASIAVILGLLAAFAVFALDRGFRARAGRIVAEASMHEVDLATQKLQFKALAQELDTHKRLERELTQAKQAAESATMAKGEFLATMSHEIRTPLNGILPMLDMLRGSRLDADQRELLATAHTSAKQLLRIVDDILDYSKLEANKLELELVSFNLRELLESVIRLMQRAAENKGLRLIMQFDARIRPAMRGDPTRLRQVLTNLVSNSIKFTERGTVSVSVKRLEDSRTHQKLHFEVRDSGIGIEPDKVDKLFAPFIQADASTTRMYGGTGLGLVISKRIVDLMGGRIGVDSEPGKGSKFWFETPLLKAIGDIEGPRVELGGANVLLLTSDPSLQRRLRIALVNWGVRVQAVDTTQEALDGMRAALAGGPRRHFHLLLADLASIRSTAVALHRNIRRQDELDPLRIIYLQGADPVPLELIEPERVLVVPRTLADAALRVQLSNFLAHHAHPPAGDSAAQESELWPQNQARADLALVRSPAPAVPERPRAAPAGTPARPAAAQAPGLSGRLLLVEDNPVNLMVAQRVLRAMGLECETAQDGQQALDRLAVEAFDLVLMDCQMPVLDGLSATRRWREIEQREGRARIPVIAMTANAMAGDRQNCLEAGMDDYLAKPVAREKLQLILRHWLDASGPVATASDVAIGTGTSPAAPPPGAPAPVAAAGVAALPRTRPALDLEVIADLREVMGEEFLGLVRIFLEDSPGHLLVLQAAAANDDLAAMVGPAHTLKSASANLGALGLSEQAKRIESGARLRALDNPDAAIALFSAEYERVEQALRALFLESA